jgi:hypothetical protein
MVLGILKFVKSGFFLYVSGREEGEVKIFAHQSFAKYFSQVRAEFDLKKSQCNEIFFS